MKLCGTCGEEQPFTHFHKCARNKDGLQSRCKECKRHYDRSFGLNNPEYMARWRASNRSKTRAYLTDWKQRNPIKHRLMLNAHQAVAAAIKSRRLIKPSECSSCSAFGPRIEAHHHKGYEYQFQLDVQWLCTSCHRRAEYEQKEEQSSAS